MPLLPAARPAIALFTGLAMVTALRPAPSMTVYVVLWAFTAMLASGAGRRIGLGIAALTWALADGFIENRYGQLSWHGPSDLILLTVLTGTALVVSTHETPAPASAPKELSWRI